MSKAAYVLKLSIAGAIAAVALSYGAAVALDGIGVTPKISAPLEPRSEPVPADSPNQSGHSPSSYSPLATGSLGERPKHGYVAPDGNSDHAPVGRAAPSNMATEAETPLADYGAGLAKAGALAMPPAPEPAVELPATPSRAELPPPPPTSALRNVELLETPKPSPPPMPEERVIEIGPKKSPPAASAKSPADAVAKPKQKSRKAAKARKRKNQDPVLSFFGFD